MDKFFISVENWKKVVEAMGRSARLHYPQETGEEDYHFVAAGEEGPGIIPFNRYRCVQSLKSILFEALLGVGGYFGAEKELENGHGEDKIVVGAKACDIHGLEILDFVFQGGEVEDPFYRINRDLTLIISSDCTGHKDVCFCVLVGGKPYPETGFDLNLSPVEEGYIVEVGSEKGRALVDRQGNCFSEPAEEQLKRVVEARGELTARLEAHQKKMGYLWGGNTRELLERTFESGVWKEEAERCVECGACNFVCPTCHCFLLSDEGVETFRRVRSWDSCQYKGFSRVGGGANPRPELYQRLHNRYEKKFDFCQTVMGINGCTGCGRCVEACIGKIDMREVLKKLSGIN